MSGKSHRSIWAGAAGAVTLIAVGATQQRRHMRRIAADPAGEALHTPPTGRPVGVRSADGTRLHTEVFGPESSQTLVLAHGWTETLSIWVYVIRTLSDRGFRIVAYDLRGHGQSEPAATGDYGLARFGEDLEAVLKACVPPEQRAIVAGHSLGAMSIAAWAEHHEVERHAAGAALVNTGFGELIAQQLLFPVPPIARAVGNTIAVRGFLGSRRPLPRVSTPLDFAAIRYAAFGPSASPAQIAYYERMLLAFPPDVRAAVGLSMSDMDLYPALSRLTVPTVVIAGANDRLTPPSHGRRMTEMLPQSRGLIVLEETGHMGPLERPREISDALAELAADVVPGVGAVPA